MDPPLNLESISVSRFELRKKISSQDNTVHQEKIVFCVSLSAKQEILILPFMEYMGIKDSEISM
jgi:hypothetical protein